MHGRSGFPWTPCVGPNSYISIMTIGAIRILGVDPGLRTTAGA